jgi:hypothetical protein
MGKPSLLEIGAYLDERNITKTNVSGKAQFLSEESLSLQTV